VEPLSEAQIQKLIRQLGSDEFKQREQATRELQHRQEAEPALRQALRSPDAEVVRRARSILATLKWRRLEQARQRIRADAAAGRADLVAERLVRWQGEDNDEVCWQAVLDIGHKLRGWERQQYGRVGRSSKWDKETQRRMDYLDKIGFPGLSLRPYLVRHKVQALPADKATLEVVTPKPGAYLARGERVVFRYYLGSSLAVASSLIHLGTKPRPGDGSGCNILLCGGDVQVHRGGRLVVVCDGDLEIDAVLIDSIVVARGSVRVGERMHHCLIVAGGDVSLSADFKVQESTIRAAGTISTPPKGRVLNSDLKGGIKNALALAPVKLFDPRSLGVEVAPSKYGVRVTATTAGKAFARAGLRVDDLVLTLDSSPVRSPASFRRLLRKRLVEGGAALFEVRRKGKTVVVRIPRCAEP
jgi:hypothetical protein